MPRKTKKVNEEPTEKPQEVQKPKAKRKRGPRKTKSKTISDDTPKVPKKRGRKPKGGKIITTITPAENVIVPEPNIILHLKCGMTDLKDTEFFSNRCLKYDPSNISKIDSYQFDSKNDNLNFELISGRRSQIIAASTEKDKGKEESKSVTVSSNDVINQKLKTLAVNLHTNNISDKKSACFACTCDFDNPPIYIPKYQLNGSYHVYGCFCSPECACYYLFNQSNIDESTRFERYHLLNHIYGKIYNYEKNIKPAPNPYYTLDKFYGNLSIQEYRKLLKNDRLLLVVDKPLTRSLPELHEDNDEFTINNKALSSKFKLRRGNKKQSKADILSNTFNLS
jgi:hypothetical protein